MKRRLAALGGVLVVLMVFVLAARGARSAGPPAVRFRTVDVYIESSRPLAAYQVAIRVESGDATFLSVEGGEQPFAEPPYYDPAAQGDARIVLAALDSQRTLPVGRHRVATLHVREAGVARYDIELVAAAAADAKRVAAHAELESPKEAP